MTAPSARSQAVTARALARIPRDDRYRVADAIRYYIERCTWTAEDADLAAFARMLWVIDPNAEPFTNLGPVERPQVGGRP